MASDGDDREELGRIGLGLRMRAARQQAGLQLSQASAASGLTVGYISECERGKNSPSLQALISIADAYGLLATDLLADLYPYGSRRRPRKAVHPPPDGRSRAR